MLRLRGWDFCMAVTSTIKMYPLEYERLLQLFMSPHRYVLCRNLF